jgi:hypothetical protein
MQITKDFLEAEITGLEIEIKKANDFLIQSRTAIAVYKMLVEKLAAPEPVSEVPADGQDPA